MSDLLTIEEAADYLRLHPNTVRRMVREGRLPAAKFGNTYRLHRADVIAAAAPELSAEQRARLRTLLGIEKPAGTDGTGGPS